MISSIQFVTIYRPYFDISSAGAHSANTGGTFGKKLRMPAAAYFDIHEIRDGSRL